MKKIIVYSLCAVVLAISAWAYFFFGNNSTPLTIDQTQENETAENNTQEEVNYQATFLVYTNNTKRDFAAAMYRNQDSEVFIGGGNPNIINVNAKGITWGDFFDTLPISLTKDCLITGTGQTFCDGEGGNLRFYLNESEKPNLLETIIKPGDQALISFGSETDNIETQLEELVNLQSQ